MKMDFNFNKRAIELYHLHYEKNPVYKEYVSLTGSGDVRRQYAHDKGMHSEGTRSNDVREVQHYSQIPCLPVEFFKTRKVFLDGIVNIDYFESSGTTAGAAGMASGGGNMAGGIYGGDTSRHYIGDFSIYKKSLLDSFRYFFGNPRDYAIVALLPHYLEREHSSLVYMVKTLIEQSAHPANGFFLYNYKELYNTLARLENEGQKTLLIGVSFALLDFADFFTAQATDAGSASQASVTTQAAGMATTTDAGNTSQASITTQAAGVATTTDAGNTSQASITTQAADVATTTDAPQIAGTTQVTSTATIENTARAAGAPLNLHHTIIMETGGMKGRKKEITRSELHATLRAAFVVKHIYSEYGMAELFSQAYLLQDGKFHCPPQMRVLLRSIYDPFQSITEFEKTGGINIIDLSNIHSCPFIQTQDLGRLYPDGSFDVLGRYDNSQIRGCNLLSLQV
jgi:hypothetical protein